MTSRVQTHDRSGSTKATPLKEICSRALAPKSEWPDKDEFLDVIYWSRQIFGILLGIVWGIIPLKGFLGLVLFAGISCGVVYLYAINFQAIDEEAYGGPWELVKEGFMTSFAGFLVTWIIFYTGLHYDAIMAAKA
ncbi:respirasome Complex Assembly Factor 1 [Teleopsis dalmanni]|uniref:respirasome Complex Assembly Factor 1-like n=1 Tax=Teleopsis dalmanni TaxID=139649 RepID=UPI0018CED59D|nr:respirasome Complex Assembly Factor 1-like [Teleopsis dalmanni]XP_037949961.1 respirasome Complex Assembly Factor 1-like [Teleopsis dalmanni]XP_037949962.1 respirasome Complex Assembly Factor 1-like [Teleopsis dalmanni]XP_037952288.1 respirasome Complex Assembly Factor 1 [Teleopsis dalmanni]XP_037952289.1 respirasome Complex Assembly Factor 1 [Teleopsis dalmanni]